MRTLVCVIDRIEGKVAVVEADDGPTFNVGLTEFARRPREGMVYRVPLSETGEPRWKKAAVDEAEADRRREAAKMRMDKLRAGDSGGDLKL